jgi:PilZ domain
MMGIIQLSPAMLLPIHSVGAITLVWFLHHVCLMPSNTVSQARHTVSQAPHTVSQARHDVTKCLSELGIQPAGPDSRVQVNLAVGERRQDIRIAENNVPVFIHDEFGFCQGRVINSSGGGLCIASEAHVTVGQAIRIQSQFDSNSAPSFDLKVCHVRKEGDEWIFGCKFLQEQDPAVLTLFG